MKPATTALPPVTDSLPEFVESIQAMSDAIGADHTGIGTDTDPPSPRPGQGSNNSSPNLPGGFFPAVIGEIMRHDLG